LKDATISFKSQEALQVTKSFASVLVRQYTCRHVGDVLSRMYTQHKTFPFYLHIQGLAFQGIVLAIPLFGHLMISRHGLAIQSVGGWHPRGGAQLMGT